MSDLVGYYEGARVEVEWREGHQVVIVHIPPRAETSSACGPVGLVDALVGYHFHGFSEPPGARAEFVHDEEVDRRIVELIDLLARLRELHPRFIQLPLALSPEEQSQIEAVLVR